MSLILWSGGCDSTLMLYYEATTAHAAGEPMPSALSIDYDDQLANTRSQANARAALLKEFGRRGLRIPATTLTISKQGNLWVERHEGGGLIQPLWWLSLAQTFLKPEEDLYLAYIRGDDIWHYREHLVAAFVAGQAMLKKTGKLCLPFEWVEKQDVLKELKQAGLDKLCWYCECAERGAAKPCGWCPSCKTMAAGRYLAKRKWGYDKPPEPEKEDEPKKNSAARRRGQAQRKTPLSRGRRSRKAGETQKREAARPRRVR